MKEGRIIIWESGIIKIWDPVAACSKFSSHMRQAHGDHELGGRILSRAYDVLDGYAYIRRYLVSRYITIAKIVYYNGDIRNVLHCIFHFRCAANIVENVLKKNDKLYS